MPEDEQNRRERDRTVDANLRFTTTITFVLAAMVSVATAVRMYSVVNERLTAVEVVNERTLNRQDLYIERDGVTHDQMDSDMEDMHHENTMLRLYLAAKFGEIVP